MTCQRCPHHVRHGQMSEDRKTLTFTDICGLKVKAHDREEEALRERMTAAAVGPERSKMALKELQKPRQKNHLNAECIHVPFPAKFEYRVCNVYIETFKSTEQKNDVLPTKDFQYSEALIGGSI